MGYGGALIYSGLAWNLKKRWPKKKVVFVYPWNLDELVWRKGAGDRLVWAGNPDIDLIIDNLRWKFVRHRFPRDETFVVNIDRDPRHFYWLKDYGDYITYKSGKHAIQIACDAYNLENCELRSRLVLTADEKARVVELLREKGLTPSTFMCVEPHTKDTFSPNKSWFFDRWQEVVRRLDVPVVQIGSPDSPLLEGVVSLVGQTTFRETGGVLAAAKLLVSAEGGLPHLATAVGTPAVVLMSNVLPPELMAYPQNKNLYADQTCVCRGLKTPCPRGRACMAKITVDNVLDAINNQLSETIPQPEETLTETQRA